MQGVNEEGEQVVKREEKTEEIKKKKGTVILADSRPVEGRICRRGLVECENWTSRETKWLNGKNEERRNRESMEKMKK